jgi:hypothetical protein
MNPSLPVRIYLSLGIGRAGLLVDVSMVRSPLLACKTKCEGLIFGRTEALQTAFEEAKPKTVATLQSAGRIELPETPSHVRFSASEDSLVLALPQTGLLVLNTASLQQNVLGPP